ncbi:hypothetical protein [Methylobacterium tarhaniae]|nr:hypothetical protein [Methylobacterium tarhaniae]
MLTYNNVTPSARQCGVQFAAEQGVQITSNQGRATVKGFTTAWNYDPSAQTVSLQCTDSPFIWPCSIINNFIDSTMHNCLSRKDGTIPRRLGEEALGAFSHQLADALGLSAGLPRERAERAAVDPLYLHRLVAGRDAPETMSGPIAESRGNEPAEMGAAPHAGAGGQGRARLDALGGGGLRAGEPANRRAQAPGVPILPGAAGTRRTPGPSPRRPGRQRPVQLRHREVR